MKRIILIIKFIWGYVITIFNRRPCGMQSIDEVNIPQGRDRKVAAKNAKINWMNVNLLRSLRTLRLSILISYNTRPYKSYIFNNLHYSIAQCVIK